MAYKTKDIEQSALKAISQHKLFFLEDVFPYLPCSRSTFYNKELDKLDSIKEALYSNRTEVKVSMRNKWYKSQNATLQLALYKMLATEEEFNRISGVKIDQNTNVSGAMELNINLTNETGLDNTEDQSI